MSFPRVLGVSISIFIICVSTIVERYHRAFEYECLRIYRPHNLETATAVTAAYQRFYNDERPHQGLSCGNVPPRVAFPALPVLPAIPALVDADRWLEAYDGQSFARKVQWDGRIMVADLPYFVRTTRAGQQVAARVDAAVGQFVVEADGQELQRLAIKGVGLGRLPFATFVDRLCADLRAVKHAPPRHMVQQRWG